MKLRRPSSPAALLIGIVAVLGLGACTSQPSAKAVAGDVIDALVTDGDPDLTSAQRDCLLDKLDGYSSDELTTIGEANEEIDFSEPDAIATQGTDEMKKFVADLHTCMGSS